MKPKNGRLLTVAKGLTRDAADLFVGHLGLSTSSNPLSRAVFSKLFQSQQCTVYLLPNENIWALTKFKAFADDKSNLAKMLIFLLDSVENIVEKGENAGYQHFLLFPQCFQKASF